VQPASQLKLPQIFWYVLYNIWVILRRNIIYLYSKKPRLGQFFYFQNFQIRWHDVNCKIICKVIVHFKCVFLSLNINIVVDFVQFNIVWDFYHDAHTSILFVCRLYRFLNINVFLYIFKKLGCPSIVLYSEMVKIVIFSIQIS
jgi:hypothetical protein